MKPLPPQPDPEQLLTAYLLGELSPDQCRSLESELAKDASLRSQLDFLSKTVSLLKKAGPIECGEGKKFPESLTFSVDRRAQLLKTLSSNPATTQPQISSSRIVPWYFHLGAASGIAALLMLSLAFQFLSSNSPATREVALELRSGIEEEAKNDSWFSNEGDSESLAEIEELDAFIQPAAPASASVDRDLYFKAGDEAREHSSPRARRLLESAPEAMPRENALARTATLSRQRALGDSSGASNSLGRNQAVLEPTTKSGDDLIAAFSAPEAPTPESIRLQPNKPTEVLSLSSTLSSKQEEPSNRNVAAPNTPDPFGSIAADAEDQAAMEFSDESFSTSSRMFGQTVGRNEGFSTLQLPAVVGGSRPAQRAVRETARASTQEPIGRSSTDDSSFDSVLGIAGGAYGRGGGGGGLGGGAGGFASATASYDGAAGLSPDEAAPAGMTFYSNSVTEQATSAGRELARTDNLHLGLERQQIDQQSYRIAPFDDANKLGEQVENLRAVERNADLIGEQRQFGTRFAVADRSRGSAPSRKSSNKSLEVDPLTGLPAPSFSPPSIQVAPQSGLPYPSASRAPLARFSLVPQLSQTQANSPSSNQWGFAVPSESDATTLDRKMVAANRKAKSLANDASTAQYYRADIETDKFRNDAPNRDYQYLSESLVAEDIRDHTDQSRPELLTHESETLVRRSSGIEESGLFASAESTKPLAQQTALDALTGQPLIGKESEIALAQQTKKTNEEAKDTLPAFPVEIETKAEPTSTFSLNVSEVSFRLAAAALNQGQLPDPTTIRPEEFFNALPYHDLPQQSEKPVVVQTERVTYPFGHQQEILRVSVRTTATGRSPSRPLNLVVLLDNSGSMERPDRQLILRRSLETLMGTLRSKDVVSLLTFARNPRLRIDGQNPESALRSLESVLQLVPEGGTNLEKAIGAAYEVARKHFQPRGENRIILLTDGAANLGNTDHDSLRQLVTEQRDQGIALDGFGIGWEGFDDQRLEALTRNGDGRYAFLNNLPQVESDFQRHLTGALNVAAKNVKVQVTFNPQRVSRYRQIGYAKHQLKAEDFRNNKVDAAELSATEAGTALYVITPNHDGHGPIGELAVRFQDPESGTYEERHWPLHYHDNGIAFEKASTETQLATVAALFAERLAGIPYSSGIPWQDLISIADRATSQRLLEPSVAQLKEMILQSQSLSGF